MREIDICIISMAFLLTNSILFTITYFIALFNNYEILVKINTVHEVWVELPMIIIGWVFTICCIILLLKKNKIRYASQSP